MSNGNDGDDELLIDDFVDHAVVTLPDTVGVSSF